MVLKNWTRKLKIGGFFPLELLTFPDKTVFRELSQFAYVHHENNIYDYIWIVLLLLLLLWI